MDNGKQKTYEGFPWGTRAIHLLPRAMERAEPLDGGVMDSLYMRCVGRPSFSMLPGAQWRIFLSKTPEGRALRRAMGPLMLYRLQEADPAAPLEDHQYFEWVRSAGAKGNAPRGVDWAKLAMSSARILALVMLAGMAADIREDARISRIARDGENTK